MIKAVIFDLDGTLVDSESLKSLAYYQAIEMISPGAAAPEAVEKAYQAVVGRSRQEVSAYLVVVFCLEPAIRNQMKAIGVDHAWQVLAQRFGELYAGMLADPQRAAGCLWPYALDALRCASQNGRLTALASMSNAVQVGQILALTGLDRLHSFDLVLTRDQVSRPKPDPEIYLLAAHRLGLAPDECLVIEDSAAGVEAALAAGMRCLGLATPMTAASLYACPGLPREWIVAEPARVVDVIKKLLVLK